MTLPEGAPDHNIAIPIQIHGISARITWGVYDWRAEVRIQNAVGVETYQTARWRAPNRSELSAYKNFTSYGATIPSAAYDG